MVKTVHEWDKYLEILGWEIVWCSSWAHWLKDQEDFHFYNYDDLCGQKITATYDPQAEYLNRGITVAGDFQNFSVESMREEEPRMVSGWAVGKMELGVLFKGMIDRVSSLDSPQ